MSYVRERASASHNETSPVASCTVTIPAAIQAGDALYLFVTNRDAGGVLVAVSDDEVGGNEWDDFAANGQKEGSAWWKYATANSAGKTITITGGVTSICAILVGYYNHAGGTPPHQNVTVEDNGAGAETHAAITTAAPHSLVTLSVFNHRDNTNITGPGATNPSSLLVRQSKTSNPGISQGSGVDHASAPQFAAGDTGTLFWGQVNFATCSIVFSIPPFANTAADNRFRPIRFPSPTEEAPILVEIPHTLGVSPVGMFTMATMHDPALGTAEQSGMAFGFGLADASRQAAVSGDSRDGLAASDATRNAWDDACLALRTANLGTVLKASLHSWDSEKVVLNFETTNATARDCAIWLWGGADTEAYMDAIGVAVGNNTITAPGREPDMLITLSADKSFDAAAASTALFHLGIAANDGLKTQYSFNYRVTDNSGGSVPDINLQSDNVKFTLVGSPNITRVLSYNDLGFVLHVDDDTTPIAYLSLYFGGGSFGLRHFTTPTGIGDQDFVCGHRPEGGVILGTSATTIETGATNASGFGLGAFHAEGDQVSQSQTMVEGANPTDTKSNMRDKALLFAIDGETNAIVGELLSTGNDRFTINYSLTDVTPRFGVWASFGDYEPLVVTHHYTGPRAADFIWPIVDLAPNDIGVNALSPNIGVGRTITGFMQTIQNDPGFLVVDYNEVPLTSPDYIRQWRAMKAKLNGREKSVLIPLYDEDRAPEVGTLVLCDGGAAARDMEFQVEVSGGEIEKGMLFSIGERAYIITDYQVVLSGPSSTTALIKVFPPVREAIADAAELEFQQPVMRARLESNTAMNMVLTFHEAAFGNARFVEDY